MAKLNSLYRVAMLGTTATGKTSMLAALYDQFSKVVGTRAGLMLVADTKTSQRLTDLLSLLKRAVVGASGARVNTQTVPYTALREEFSFSLMHKDSDTKFDIRFDDYPGGWIRTKREAVEEIVENSRVVIVAVDSPALMKYPDYLYTELHRPEEIADILQASINKVRTAERFTAPEKEFLVLFIAMKCERWTPQETMKLYVRFQQAYEKATLILQTLEVPIGFLPVQTLGSVEFDEGEYNSRVDARPNAEEEYHKFSFNKRSNSGFAPVDCDQPLRYLLGHLFGNLKDKADHTSTALQEEIKKRSKAARVSYWFANIFNADQKRNTLRKTQKQANLLLKEMDAFSKNRKTVNGFIYLDWSEEASQ